MTDMIAVAVPLWALMLNFSPSEIGIVIGARNVLPLLLGIHGGILMDRFGTRRVLFFIAILAGITSPLYPLLPWFPAVIVLQLIGGYATNIGYVGAQALVGRLTGGEARHFGNLIFITRIGTFIAPILIGAIWDLFGPWGAFPFIGLWGLVLLVLVQIAPNPPVEMNRAPSTNALRDIVPRISDYKQCLSLLAIPTVAMAVAISSLRATTGGIQDSFYLVHLNTLGFTGSMIGFLIATMEFTSGFGSLASGRMVRLMKPHWLLIILTVMAIVLITITPLLGTVLALLVIAQAARGFLQGVILPVVLHSITRAVRPEDQGLSLGLRMAATRLTATVIPVIMGIVAEFAGIDMSFYLVGGAVIVLLAIIACLAYRSKSI